MQLGQASPNFYRGLWTQVLINKYFRMNLFLSSSPMFAVQLALLQIPVLMDI